jgi:drug/metabolite transporter (DMT)-like permease
MDRRVATAPDRLSATGLAQLGVSVVLLASGWPVTKYAIGYGAPPPWFAAGRAGLSALVAALVLAALGRLRPPRPRDRPAVIGVGLFQLAAFFALATAAVAWVPAGRTTVLANVTTVFIVPLSWLVLRERIPPRRWLATAFGLAGVVVLMNPWAIDWQAPHILLGHLFLLGAALGFSVAIMVVRRFPPERRMLDLLPWCFALATLVLAPLALWQGGGFGHWQAPALWSLVYVGAIAGPLGTWCAMEAAAALPAVVSSVGFLATPAAGLLMATVGLGEPLGADLIGGTVLILAGVGAAAWPARR